MINYRCSCLRFADALASARATRLKLLEKGASGRNLLPVSWLPPVLPVPPEGGAGGKCSLDRVGTDDPTGFSASTTTFNALRAGGPLRYRGSLAKTKPRTAGAAFPFLQQRGKEAQRE
jgi:hypothetical protein